MNQFIEPHLDLLIEEEKLKIKSLTDYSKDMYEMLKNLKEIQKSQVKEIEEGAKNESTQLNLEDIDSIANQLCKLKHSGIKFKKLIEQFLKDNISEMIHVEKDGVDLSENKLLIDL